MAAFLGVFEIIEPEADDLARPGRRWREGDVGKRKPGGRGSAFRNVAERFEIAVVFREPAAEVARHAWIHRLQVDHAVAFHDTEPQRLVFFEPDDLQHPPHPFARPVRPGRSRYSMSLPSGPWRADGVAGA